jgi:hypothetical protein
MKIEDSKYNDLMNLYQKLLEKNCDLIDENTVLHNLVVELRYWNKKLEIRARNLRKELRKHNIDIPRNCGKLKIERIKSV